MFKSCQRSILSDQWAMTLQNLEVLNIIHICIVNVAAYEENKVSECEWIGSQGDRYWMLLNLSGS